MTQVPLQFADSVASTGDYLPVAPTTSAHASRIAAGALDSKVSAVADYVAARGFVFQPWQIASYITAVRTKPFVILAGISGTGKSRLPRLIAEAAGAAIDLVSVRPDWTDSSELLGYTRLDGTFVPGRLLQAARRAMEAPERQHFVLLDEMNLARVEYYLAEVLSLLEDRRREDSRLVSDPILPDAPAEEWASVRWPSNLCLVGSVNMDETTHGFSRKVLDRAFVIEFSDIDLNLVGTIADVKPQTWSPDDWVQHYATLGEFPQSDDAVVLDVIGTLNRLNDHLSTANLQVGYRVRDEIALFCVNAQAVLDFFAGADGVSIDPLDLAIAMKILPRIQGSGTMIHTVLDALATWANAGATGAVDGTVEQPDLNEKSFPFCAARVSRMLQRLESDGYASYWL